MSPWRVCSVRAASTSTGVATTAERKKDDGDVGSVATARPSRRRCASALRPSSPGTLAVMAVVAVVRPAPACAAYLDLFSPVITLHSRMHSQHITSSFIQAIESDKKQNQRKAREEEDEEGR